MQIKSTFKEINEERYIEIKKIAYDLYKKYSSLSKKERKEFLSSLPDLGSKYENGILKNTILIPDTEYLISSTNLTIYPILKEIYRNEDNITLDDISFKNVEYSFFDIRKLIKEGKLEIMNHISYPDNSISDKQYIQLKNEVLNFMNEFRNLSLTEKVNMIEASCSTVNSYQSQIQLSTLLIPNDELLMNQLQNLSIDKVAAYYGVPESVINFKIEEYNRQETLYLIQSGQIDKNNYNRSWDKTSLNDSMIYTLWEQDIYKSMNQEGYIRVNKSLSKRFSEYSKTIKK